MMNNVNGINGGNKPMAPAKNQPAKEKKSGGIAAAKKTDKFETVGGVRLSESAQKLLKELQLKYKDTDFVIADYSSDDEASKLLAGGTKEYSVLIDPESLEKMAADQSVREKYEGMIDQSREQINNVRDQLIENGKTPSVVGANVSEDGTMSMFAELEEMTERRNEHIEESREAARKDRAEAKKEAEKAKGKDKPEKAAKHEKPEKTDKADKAEKAEKPGKPGKPEPPIKKVTRFIADSAESLLDKIFSFFGIERKTPKIEE